MLEAQMAASLGPRVTGVFETFSLEVAFQTLQITQKAKKHFSESCQ